MENLGPMIQKKIKDEELKKNMKILYYYHKDLTNRPDYQNIFTTCLVLDMRNFTVLSRGVTICSLLDKDCHNKNTARAKSLGRAISALVKEKNGFPLRNTNIPDPEFVTIFENLIYTSRYYKFKSEYKPELTWFEKQMVESEKKAKKMKDEKRKS